MAGFKCLRDLRDSLSPLRIRRPNPEVLLWFCARTELFRSACSCVVISGVFAAALVDCDETTLIWPGPMSPRLPWVCDYKLVEV